MIHHAHARDLVKKFLRIPFHKLVKVQICFREGVSHGTVVDTGLIHYRKRHGILCHLKKFISHSCSENCKMRILRSLFWMKSFEKFLFIEGSSFIFTVGSYKIF